MLQSIGFVRGFAAHVRPRFLRTAEILRHGLARIGRIGDLRSIRTQSFGKDPSLEMLNVAVEVSRYHANAHLVPVQGRSALPAGDGLWMRRDGEPQSGYRATPAEARTITTMGVVGVRNLFHDQPAWDQG